MVDCKRSTARGSHPDLHEPLKDASEKIGRHVQHLIVDALPEVADLLEAGWHREFDYIADEDDQDDDDDDDDDETEAWYGEQEPFIPDF